MAYCDLSEGLRVFRLDRVHDAQLAEADCEMPESFSVSGLLREPRAFVWEGVEHMRVRYSPRIARSNRRT